MTQERAQWGSRFGFILAAAGSAVGLGNIWKFPYITGENGGGWFVIIYLFCVLLVGLPVMTAEIFIGRTAKNSPVGAFRALSHPGSPWIGVGIMGVVAGFVILSYYSVVAGWALHYVYLSVTNAFAGMESAQVGGSFGALFVNGPLNLLWHVVFMIMTIAIVLGGVREGVERWARILMPALFLMMAVLLVRAATLSGFGNALDFVFGLHADKLRPAGVLEALGHAFFTLSLGMGAMITYGSYLSQKDDLFQTSLTVGVLDTVIALMACMVLFPITFSFGMEPSAGPGLVFQSLPIAFSQMPGGPIWSTIFFILLVFAALTSAISLLEVTSSYFIDEKGWTRKKATWVCGLTTLVVGIPSALSGGKLFGDRFAEMTAPVFHLLGHEAGKNWFDTFDYLASNWLLPLGGLGIALFVAWRIGDEPRRRAFEASGPSRLYWGWVMLLRYVVPIGVGAVFLHLIGLY
ncbi:MAG: sodium-dependent transporter [Candidatus Eisenbacteria bacterium]